MWYYSRGLYSRSEPAAAPVADPRWPLGGPLTDLQAASPRGSQWKWCWRSHNHAGLLSFMMQKPEGIVLPNQLVPDNLVTLYV